MKTTIRITNVDFDTDGNKSLAKYLRADAIGKTIEIEHKEDEDPMDLLPDAVSDKTGWCIFNIAGEKV
jgi:hypothetical protein